jgi:hypothetical protein
MNDQPNPLMEFILRLLAPLLMAGSVTDLERARQAAVQAIEIYTARGQSELITIGQIVGFAITALDDLRLSMGPDLSLSMKLKLRGNANALNRSSLHATATLNQPRPAPTWAPEEPATPTEPTKIEPAEIEPVSATLPVAQQNRLNWANAMSKTTADLQSRAAQVSPAQRQTDRRWINVLTEVAGQLRAEPQPAETASATTNPVTAALAPQTRGPIANPAPRKASAKASLLRTTMMASGANLPTDLIAPAK